MKLFSCQEFTPDESGAHFSGKIPQNYASCYFQRELKLMVSSSLFAASHFKHLIVSCKQATAQLINIYYKTVCPI